MSSLSLMPSLVYVSPSGHLALLSTQLSNYPTLLSLQSMSVKKEELMHTALLNIGPDMWTIWAKIWGSFMIAQVLLNFFEKEIWNVKTLDLFYIDGKRNDNHFGENPMKTRNDVYETLCPQPFACQEGFISFQCPNLKKGNNLKNKITFFFNFYQVIYSSSSTNWPCLKLQAIIFFEIFWLQVSNAKICKGQLLKKMQRAISQKK